jgi:hypothetical protein
MVIDCIDMTDPVISSSTRAWLSQQSVVSTQLQFYGMSNGVTALVQAISGVATTGTIDVLRIWGHGHPGSQNVSAGKDDGSDDGAAIDADSFYEGDLAKVLAPLAPLFSASARAELRGCNVGEGGAGSALLLDLADLWHVPVYGGDVLQYASGGWKPPVSCGNPGGGLASTNGPDLNGNF